MNQPTPSDVDELPFGIPQAENEVPLFPSSMSKEDLEALKIKNDNKDKKRKDKRYYTAFKLIVGCLVLLCIVYIIDVALTAYLKKDVSSLTKDVIEIIKTLLFTLSGYIFAKKENGD